MRGTTIRFPDPLRDLIDAEARRQGIDLATFVREACLGRVLWHYAIRAVERDPQHADTGWLVAIRELLEEIERREAG